MKMNKTLSWFRRVAIAEGVSFLVLLLVAMPLKYLGGLPQAVTWVGWAHGLLFVAFLALALEVKAVLQKPFGWLVKAFFAALLPLGTFVLHRQLQKEGAYGGEQG